MYSMDSWVSKEVRAISIANIERAQSALAASRLTAELSKAAQDSRDFD